MITGFIQLTDKNGKKAWANIDYIKAVIPHENHTSIIFEFADSNGDRVALEATESVEEIMERIAEALV